MKYHIYSFFAFFRFIRWDLEPLDEVKENLDFILESRETKKTNIVDRVRKLDFYLFMNLSGWNYFFAGFLLIEKTFFRFFFGIKFDF